MLNITCEQTAEEIMKEVGGIITIPSLIILWLSFIFFLPIITYAFKSKNTDWGRFWGVWIVLAVLTGIILIWLIMSPNSVMWIMDLFKI